MLNWEESVPRTQQCLIFFLSSSFTKWYFFMFLVSFNGSWVFPLLSSCLSLLYSQYRPSWLLPTYLLRLILLISFLIFHYGLLAKLMRLPTNFSELWPLAVFIGYSFCPDVLCNIILWTPNSDTLLYVKYF